MADLGIRHVPGLESTRCTAGCWRVGLTATQTAYAGGDVVDLPILLDAGGPQADAHPGALHALVTPSWVGAGRAHL